MATAVLTNTPTVLNNGDSVTGWNGDTFSVEPDIKVQGTNSVACVQTDNGANDIYVTGFTGFSINTVDVHFRLWFNITFIGNLAATNAIQVWCTDGTNTAYWTWDGGAAYAGGWAQAIIYTGLTPTSGTKPTGTITQVGLRFNTASKPRNVPANSWFDYWTYGDGFTVTGGTSGDPIDWSHIAAVDTDVTNTAYNIVSKIGGVYFIRGDIQIGDGTSTTYFEPSGQIAVFPNEQVSTSLYSISFVDSASNLTNVVITGGTIASESISYRYGFDVSDTNINSFTQNGTQMAKAGLTYYYAGATVQSVVYDNCLQVDPSTSAFTSCTFSNSVDTGGALLFPSNDSNISGLNFVNCDNGVEYASTSDATSPSFNDFTFDDVSGNYDVNNTSGSSVTISKNNGSNPNSYNPGGSVVTFAGASVTTLITVRDLATGSVLENARVLVYPTDGVNFPYLDTITITGSGTTATVAHTGHGLSTGDHVIINGANEDVYNGVYQITVTGVDSYTYTTNETIGTSPATGTISATFAFISALTNASGQVSDTRQVGSDQSITGRVRKASASPYYQSQIITGTVSSTGGFSTTIQLPRDE